MIYSIDKCMKTTIVEVIYHSAYCIIGCTRRGRCVETVVVRTPATVRWWYNMITMRGLGIGRIIGLWWHIVEVIAMQ